MPEIQKGFRGWMDSPKRADSTEVDYGCWWKLGEDDRNWWRISYIENTGELYAMHLLANEFMVLANLPSLAVADEVMANWAAVSPDLDQMMALITSK